MTPKERETVRFTMKPILRVDALDYPGTQVDDCRTVIAILEREIEQGALAARRKGLSWQGVGTMLGVSKQAAQQRFGADE